jgi:hypothetical protein
MLYSKRLESFLFGFFLGLGFKDFGKGFWIFLEIGGGRVRGRGYAGAGDI